jgi:hypothetical protein
LLSRGQKVILAGRNAEALRKTAQELNASEQVEIAEAAIDDPAALRDLAARATVIIHCAGPFGETGPPVATAALEAGCAYVDHALEAPHVKLMFDEMQDRAQRAGVLMFPQASLYGGFGDLLASVVTEEMPEVDRVTVGYWISGWRLTAGGHRTYAMQMSNLERMITFADGVHRVGPAVGHSPEFPFPPPVGPCVMLAPFPTGEVVTIPRHVSARAVEVQLSASTFQAPETFGGKDADEATRAQSRFIVGVDATGKDGSHRRGFLIGGNMWRVAALLSVEVAVRVARGEVGAESGVLSTAEAFPARQLLRTLERQGAFTAMLPAPTNDQKRFNGPRPSA